MKIIFFQRYIRGIFGRYTRLLQVYWFYETLKE